MPSNGGPPAANKINGASPHPGNPLPVHTRCVSTLGSTEGDMSGMVCYVTPGNCPLSLYRGDDWAMTVKIEDSDGGPVDLTGWTAKAQIRKRATDKTIVKSLNVAIDTLILNQIFITLTSTESAALSSNGVWDLELTDPSGKVQTVLAGAVTVTLDVTRV